MKNLLLFLIISLIGRQNISSFETSNMEVNKWVKITPKWKKPIGISGSFQERGWCTMRFNSQNKTFIFYEGFGPSDHGNYCIYANSLYQYYPTTDTIEVASLSNWYCNAGSAGTDISPLASNAINPTPRDRHTTNQFAYSPTDNRVYLCHGASKSNQHPHDFWSYSFEKQKWENLGAAPGGTEGWECTCSQNLIYNPNTDELYLFLGRSSLYVYGIKSKAWRKVNLNLGAAGEVGSHGTFDTKRNIFVFYGNDYTSNDVGSTMFAFFDAKTNTWLNKAPSGNWPPAKSYASLEYNSKFDVYMLHGGYNQNDTWIYEPVAGEWTKIVSATNPDPSAMKGTYLSYDSTRNILATLSGGNMWLFKYSPPKAGIINPSKPGHGIHTNPLRFWEPSFSGSRIVFNANGNARRFGSTAQFSSGSSAIMPSGIYFIRKDKLSLEALGPYLHFE
jgi:hypothetical protein